VSTAAVNVYRVSDWPGGVPRGDTDVVIRAAGGLKGIRQQHPWGLFSEECNY
jgi:hypothetical protein